MILFDSVMDLKSLIESLIADMTNDAPMQKIVLF